MDSVTRDNIRFSYLNAKWFLKSTKFSISFLVYSINVSIQGFCFILKIIIVLT